MMSDSVDEKPETAGQTPVESNNAAVPKMDAYSDAKAAVVSGDEEAAAAVSPSVEDVGLDAPKAVDVEENKAVVAFAGSTKEEKREMLKSSGLTSGPIDDLPFESHFTLRIPTSTLHYRGTLLRVIDTDNDQIILRQVEEDNKKKILVKRISPDTLSQKILRVGYTLVTILFCGFLFVFCFQVLLLLVIAVQVYSSNKAGELGQISGFTLLSTLLAFPMMLYSMSSLMAMGSGKTSNLVFLFSYIIIIFD
jgi:hypothetical protein